MKRDFNARRDVWGPIVSGQLLQIADQVIGPLEKLDKLGGLPQESSAPFPVQFRAQGQGQKWCRRSPRFMTRAPAVPDTPERSCFNEIAPDYCEALGRLYERLVESAAAMMSPYLGPSFRVLDAGCGPGRLTERLARCAPWGEAVGIDISEHMLAQARSWCIERGSVNVALRHAALETFEAGSPERFDAEVCFLSFAYFKDKASCGRRLAELCADEGILFVVEPDPDINGRIWYDRTDRLLFPQRPDRLSMDQIAALLAAEGFERIGCRRLAPGFSACCGIRGKRNLC